MSQTRWRVGRKLGRTIYEAVGSEPSDADVLIGMMDTVELAESVVRAFNHHRYTVDSYLVGPAIAPCVICGRGRQDHEDRE